MSGLRDYSPLFWHGRCVVCNGQLTTETPAAHAQIHLSDGQAVVVIRGGKQVVRPTYEIADKAPPDEDGQATAKRAVAKDFAEKHRGIKLPKGRKEWKP